MEIANNFENHRHQKAGCCIEFATHWEDKLVEYCGGWNTCFWRWCTVNKGILEPRSEQQIWINRRSQYEGPGAEQTGAQAAKPGGFAACN